MTSIEHAMLGVNGALALGLHRRLGWSSVVVCGFAAVAPDWDGLPMLFDMERFESGHRVWGHNLLACVLLGVFLGTLDWKFRWSDLLVAKLGSMTGPKLTGPKSHTALEIGNAGQSANSIMPRTPASSWWTWCVIAIIAAMSQIPADAVVSGGRGLSDWPLKPLWPFSDWKLVYPMIPWGNVGVSVIFGVAVVVMAKLQSRFQLIAIAALIAMCIYLVFWKTVMSQPL